MSPGPTPSIASTEAASDAAVELRSGIPGSVRAGVRMIEGHQVVSFTISGDLRSMSQADGMTIGAACELARAKGHPVVGFVQSTGADVREGITAAHGWGSAARAMIKCSGIVPTVLVVTGPVVSGPALMLGLADAAIMVDDSYAFVSGPTMVEQFTGLPVDHDDLGGPSIHATRSGVVTAVVADEAAAKEMVGELLGYLPASNSELAPFRPTADPVDRPCPELRDIVSDQCERKLRRAPCHRIDRRRQHRDRATSAMGGQPHHRIRQRWWPCGRHRRQPATSARRHARHRGLTKGCALCGPVRRIQCAAADLRRHSRLSAGQGPRMARHDPPWRSVGIRVRAGDRSPHLDHAAQKLRRCVHRDGFQTHG